MILVQAEQNKGEIMESKYITNKTYIEVNVAQIIDRNTEEGDFAWTELTNHHAIPYVKDGRYPLNQFWLEYSNNPYENLQKWKEYAGDGWEGEGMLGKVVADYLARYQYKGDYSDILLYVTW